MVEAAARVSEPRVAKVGIDMEALWKVLGDEQSDNVVRLAGAFDRPGCGELGRIFHGECRLALRLTKEAPTKSGVIVAHTDVMHGSVVLPGITGPVQFHLA